MMLGAGDMAWGSVARCESLSSSRAELSPVNLADLSLLQFFAAALIVAGGAAVQSAVGFGLALFVVPLLLWTGFALPEAVAIVIGGAFVQAAIGSWSVRADISWRRALSFAAIVWLFIPVGVLAMALVRAAIEVDTLKQAVGALILVLLLVRLLLRPTPRREIGRGWMALAAAATGSLGGLVGMPGPPMALYALAHEWNKQEFRGFLWSQFVLALPILLLVLTLREGPQVLLFAGLGLACAPMIGLGARLGARVSERWGQAQIQHAATILMFAVALWSIVGPLLLPS
jgi:uncharacterized membrane protein YfcA